MPIFGVSIYSISRKIIDNTLTPQDAVKWLGAQGAQAIELVPFGFDPAGNPGLIDPLLRAAESAGTRFINYSLNANFLQITPEEYEGEITRVQSHMDAARQLGLPTIRVDCSAYRRPLNTVNTEDFQRDVPLIINTYRRLCDYAAPLGLTVLLENHGFHVNGAERTRQIVTSVGRGNFGFQLDVGNFVCVDDIAEVASARLLPFAATIHMKDFYLRRRDPGDATQFDCSGSWFKSVAGTYLRGAILGQGDLDMHRIIGDIKRSGFDGPIIVEYEGMEDCFYGTKVSLDNLKRLYAEV
jgi:sugar phosphate isomerase/epimerase